MAQRSPTKNFVRYAPARRDQRRKVRIRISNMTGQDAIWWDAKVVPEISKEQGRADRFWVWSAMLPALLLYELAKGRKCRPLVIWAYTDRGGLVRAAMVFGIADYPHLNVSEAGLAHFLWFMSSAPDRVLARYGVSDPPSLGAIGIDNAMVLSENSGHNGRMGLHAAPGGGNRLLTFYSKRCRLEKLSKDAPLPTAIRRKNDGRFFYADASRASSLMAERDDHR